MRIWNSVWLEYVPTIWGGLSSKRAERAMQRSTSIEHAYLTGQFVEEIGFGSALSKKIRIDFRRNTNAGDCNSSK
jgi:hypothetical protein